MAHQLEFFERFKDAEYLGNLSEQGTGKTKTFIDIAGYRYERDEIDGLLIAAPNEGDIPENWLDEVVKHLPPRIKRIGVRARASFMRVADKKLLARFAAGEFNGKKNGKPLAIVTINVELMRKGSKVFNLLLDWMRKSRVMFVVDESTRISTPSAAQTKGALKLAANAVVRSISTGTLDRGGPYATYSQMEFLSPTILDQPSFTAFKCEYSKMLPPEHGLVRHVIRQKGAKPGSPYEQRLLSIIQIPDKDAMGRPIFKNLEDLRDRVKTCSLRRLKADCLDIPPKLYAPTRYTEFTPKQKEIYEQVRTEVVAEFVHDKRIVQMTLDMAMKRLLRLQQVAGNYYSPDPDPDQPRHPPKRIEKPENNPKIAVVEQIITDYDDDCRGIIWCRFTPEIHELIEWLTAKYGADAVVGYHGGMSSRQQVDARKAFLDLKSPVRRIVGQINMGIGVDMYTASWEYFYSNSYSLEARLQAEDRGHRKGLLNPLTIFDSQTRGSIESRIVAQLRFRKEVSELILGDPPQNWI